MDSHWGLESDMCFLSILEGDKMARCLDAQTWIVNEGVLRLSPTSERAIRLDKYILAYLTRRGLTRSAGAFALEAQVNDGNIEIQDGLDIFWRACYEQRARIKTQVDLLASERRDKEVENQNAQSTHLDQLLSVADSSTHEHQSINLPAHLSHASTSNATPDDANSVEDKVFMFQKQRICEDQDIVKYKLFSCCFSSNGECLAFAGTMGEVFLWNVQSRTLLPSLMLHKTILNVCFQPSTTFLAASCGHLIYLFDSTKVREAPVILIGHVKPTEPEEYFYAWPVIKSLDFCPTDRNLLCSCDSHDEIHIWNVERRVILCRLKERGASHIKFGSKNMLAVAVGRRIMLLSLLYIDGGEIEVNSRFNLEGHAHEVNSMCWDTDSQRLASVSNETARVWALTDNEWTCHYKLLSDGYVYTCCLFHPLHHQLLIIGSYQYIQLWDTSKGSKMKLLQSGTSGFISALTGSGECRLVASASHDGQVHVWTSHDGSGE